MDLHGLDTEQNLPGPKEAVEQTPRFLKVLEGRAKY